MIINIDRLRKDLEEDSYAGAFAGMPVMMAEAWDIENASAQEVVQIVIDRGIELSDYE